jgi:soluble lytic murein transglycosylase
MTNECTLYKAAIVILLILELIFGGCYFVINWNYNNLKKEYAELVESDDVRINNLIDENYQLYTKLVQYERADVLYAINFILSKNSKIDVKKARKIAESVVARSEQFELDYKLVLAVIWQESRFNDGAKSNQNAHGLMQIIPDTQKALAKTLKIDRWDIHDIDTNILFGTAYLARLKTLYSNDLKLMLAAYNGGPTCARKYTRYINGELPADSLSSENLNYIRSITSLYGKM